MKENIEKIRIPQIVKECIVTIIIVMFVCTVIVQMGRVPSGSMEPTINTGDIAICTPLTYIKSNPQRGDIIIFSHAGVAEGETLLKRIIGLPGEDVQFIDGRVYINGQLLEEEYLKPDVSTDCEKDFEVPEGCYFVMGDNRESSYDSRFWQNPYVVREEIEAKFIACVPMSKIYCNFNS